MRKSTFILFLLTLLLGSGVAAAQDSLSTEVHRKMVGFDAGKMVNSKRSRAADVNMFVNDKFYDNLSISAIVKARTPFSADYGFAYSGGVGLTKFFTKSIGLRLDAYGGYIPYNKDATRIEEFNASASVLFNLSSYIGGYDRGRNVEFSTVLGAGYAFLWRGLVSNYLYGNIGLNVRMKASKRFSITVEPTLPMYLNRSGLRCGFGLSVGASCDLSSKVDSPSYSGRYFLTFAGGLQLQNSAMAQQGEAKDFIGMHYNLGVGRRFTDYLDLRFSATFSKNTWMKYAAGLKMPSYYYALRLEGVFDLLRVFKWDSCLGVGIVLGPETGYMVKKDLGYSVPDVYVGLSTGLHGDYRIDNRVSLFIEPRFTFVPYTAKNDKSTSYNCYRNYYDTLFNFVFGVEINLGL